MEKRDSKEGKLTIAEVESFLGTVDSCIAELAQKISQLPKVEQDGSSECPFARQLYADKEEAQKKVQCCLEKLNEYGSWVQSEIARCKNNLAVITAHENQLNNDRPREYFSDAETQLAALYNRLVQLAQKIQEAIRNIQQALEQASQKQYPGDVGQQIPSFQMPPLPGDSNLSQPDFDAQLKQMFSIGPIE
ncbi:MAG: hypothetical protein PHP01_09560 [Phycisphaerae bacterium]|nr:hypothetical protein [Phycisphaerae bacterium]